MKTVFLFSGQGSQYPGMGAELAKKSSAAKQILECGSDIMGFDLMKKLTDSTPEELAQTRLSQPAIFTTSLLALAAARENDIDNVAVAGHSLGEYAAKYASGMLGMRTPSRLSSFVPRLWRRLLKPSAALWQPSSAATTTPSQRCARKLADSAPRLTTTAHSRP